MNLMLSSDPPPSRLRNVFSRRREQDFKSLRWWMTTTGNDTLITLSERLGQNSWDLQGFRFQHCEVKWTLGSHCYKQQE